MPIAKIIEISAESTKSFDDAVQQGVADAGKSLHNVRSAWIKDQQVIVKEGRVSTYRVDMKISFVVD